MGNTLLSVFILCCSVVKLSAQTNGGKPLLCVSSSFQKSLNPGVPILRSLWIGCLNDFYIADWRDTTKQLHFEAEGAEIRYKSRKNEFYLIPDSSDVTIKILDGENFLDIWRFKTKKLRRPTIKVSTGKKIITKGEINRNQLRDLIFTIESDGFLKNDVTHLPKVKFSNVIVTLRRDRKVIYTCSDLDSFLKIQRIAKPGDRLIIEVRSFLVKYYEGKIDNLEYSYFKGFDVIKG